MSSDSFLGYTSTSAERIFEPLLHLQDSSLSAADLEAYTYSIHFRTLGNVAYFITSLNTKLDRVREMEGRILGVLGRVGLKKA